MDPYRESPRKLKSFATEQLKQLGVEACKRLVVNPDEEESDIADVEEDGAPGYSLVSRRRLHSRNTLLYCVSCAYSHPIRDRVLPLRVRLDARSLDRPLGAVRYGNIVATDTRASRCDAGSHHPWPLVRTTIMTSARVADKHGFCGVAGGYS